MKKVFPLALLLAVGWLPLPAQVLIVHAVNPSFADDVHTKLNESGLIPGQIDLFDARTATPTLLELLDYTAVFVFSDAGGFASPSDVGHILADYVDAGRGVVEAVFANVNGLNITGRWLSAAYSPVGPGGQQQNPELTLGTIHIPDHPVMENVTSFSGGSSSYRGTGSLRPSADVIAEWSNGQPLVIGRNDQFADRIILLNFFPASSDARSDFWDANTDGALLMANAINFVAVPEPSTYALMVLGIGILVIVTRRRRA